MKIAGTKSIAVYFASPASPSSKPSMIYCKSDFVLLLNFFTVCIIASISGKRRESGKSAIAKAS